MPLSNERGTPQWVSTPTREAVERYFKDLERVMRKNAVVDEAEQKEAALLYVPIAVAKRWESLPEYADPAKTYVQFRDAVLSFYLGSDVDHKFTLREYDDIVSKRIRTGINNLVEYMEFYGEFYPVARYLMQKPSPDLTQRQVADTLLRLLPDSRRPAVEARLSQKVPDKHRDDTYTVEQVHEAISHVIDNHQSFAGIVYHRDADRTPSPAPPARDRPPHMPAIEAAPARTTNSSGDVVIKAEMLQQLLATAMQSGQAAAANANQPPPPSTFNRFPDGPPRYGANGPRNTTLFGGPLDRRPRLGCFYCTQPNCSLAICPVVNEDERSGLIMRESPGGRILLRNGRELPPRRGNQSLRDVVMAYYDQNPRERPPAGGAGVNMFAVQSNLIGDRIERTVEEQLEAHQQQVALLQEVKERRDRQRRQLFDFVEIPSKPRTRSQGRKPMEKDLPVPPSNDRVSEPPRAKTPQPAAPAVERQRSPEVPLHPYAQVPDATKSGAPPKPDFAYPVHPSKESASAQAASQEQQSKPNVEQPKSREPAYRTQPAGFDPSAEDRVFQRGFVESKSITLTPLELLSLSPALCKRVHRVTGNKRVAFETPTNTAPVQVNSVAIEEVDDGDDEVDYYTREERLVASEEPTRVSASQSASAFESFQLRQAPASVFATASPNDDVIVGETTQKLRSVAAWVNDSGLVECILDPGSQIVAINASKCFELGIPYDHNSRIPMQSANGTVTETKGLARDVPVELRGGIVLYLQMHVVESAAYDILLGRPFDVLTACVAKNDSAGRQEIVVTCPNTKRSLTIPTYARGEAPSVKPEAPAGFQASRI